MKYQQAEKHFGSQIALARAFRPPAAQSSVAEWKERGEIPRGRQFELQVITHGALKVAAKYLPPALRANVSAHKLDQSA